jgi:hypothetical protein
VGAGLVATGLALAGYSHAKQQLIDAGLDREQVEKMAVGQVMATYTERSYKRLANEWEKLWYVPFSDVGKYERAVTTHLREVGPFGGRVEREVLPIVSLLFPATQASRYAQIRLDRDIAAMRVIEALRMYAAQNAGLLPRSLNEIHQVPVPKNPATGQAFVYRLEGATGILELPTSDGIPGYNRRFEIQIAENDP